MSITATPQQNHSRDVALAAIAQALEQIGHADEQLVQLDEGAFKLEKEKTARRHPSNEQSCSAEPGRGSSRGRLVLRSLMGLLALACIGVAAFAWQSTHGQAAPEPISTSSVSIKKKEPPAQPAPYDTDVAAKTDAGLPQQSSQAPTEHAAPVAPTAAPTAPDLARSIQMIARELANLEQGIDQLKTGQAQMVRDNAELAEHLKATQETARRNADLAEDLKAAQAQIARDNVNFAEQLKASQEQMADIAEQLKGSQEQIASLVASEQKQRPRTPASSPLPIANSKRKPVPTPPSSQVRVQPQDPRHLQPKQQ
ncbi:hypothetical protein [Bradyrhizobium sp.]|uniref:hypothetical protein n=1 Tax=Bradyrhizobium sp. TaxID=376 RepID=UPI003C759788